MFSIGHGIKQHCSNCLQKSNLPQTGETCIMQNLKSIPKLIILLAVPYQSGTDGPICQGTIRWPKPWNINVYRWWFCKTKWSQTIFGNLHPPFQLLSVQKSKGTNQLSLYEIVWGELPQILNPRQGWISDKDT